MRTERVEELEKNFVGRDAAVASRSETDGEVVVKWLGAVVEEVDGDDGSPSSSAFFVPRIRVRGRLQTFPPRAGETESDQGRGNELAGEDGTVRRLLMRAALATEDRKGDVIDANGWELEGFRRNPVFLWAHDRTRPPIGVAREIWVAGGSLNAVVEFAPTSFAKEISELYTRGFMRAVSVGFLPLETEIRTASNGRRGYLYRRQELLEISAVPVPMHSGALARVRSENEEASPGGGREEWSERDGTGLMPAPTAMEEEECDEDILQLRAGVRRLVAAAGLLVD